MGFEIAMHSLCASHAVLQASMQRVRDVYEAAIVQLGVDVGRGGQLWDDYRDFEERYLEVLLVCGDAKNAYVCFCLQ